LRKEKRLLHDTWWLDPHFRYGDIFFKPKNMEAEELSEMCIQARRKFYSAKSIFWRALDFQSNSHGLTSFYFYLLSNILVNKDIDLKNRTYLGLEPSTLGVS
jgi:hypothetical protein